jgi:monoamine oxidase
VALDQLAEGNPGVVRMSRIDGGADRLTSALGQSPRVEVHLDHVLRSVAQDGSAVAATVEHGRRRREWRADYLVITLPPPLVLELEMTPPLPESARRAFTSLALGAGAKTILRFRTRWWRRARRPNAFGTNLPVGAVWESAEEQKDQALLTLFAGGAASQQLQELTRDGLFDTLMGQLSFLGRPEGPPLDHAQVIWEAEPWSRGAYAVFTSDFDPHDRDLLGRAVGRVFFAGEHTSKDAQGYMEGAVESGERVAREIETLRRLETR